MTSRRGSSDFLQPQKVKLSLSKPVAPEPTRFGLRSVGQGCWRHTAYGLIQVSRDAKQLPPGLTSSTLHCTNGCPAVSGGDKQPRELAFRKFQMLRC